MLNKQTMISTTYKLTSWYKSAGHRVTVPQKSDIIDKGGEINAQKCNSLLVQSSLMGHLSDQAILHALFHGEKVYFVKTSG